MADAVEAEATGAGPRRRAGVSLGDARRGRAAGVWKCEAGQGRSAGSVDVSGGGEFLERSAVCGADVVARTWVHAGGDFVAGDWDWREHWDIQRGGRDLVSIVASEGFGAVAGRVVDKEKKGTHKVHPRVYD